MSPTTTTAPEAAVPERGQADVRTVPHRRRRRFRPRHPGVAFAAWAAAAVFFSPVLWMFLTGFKQESQASTDPPTFFFVPTLDQYRAILGRDFTPYFLNSVSASVFSTILVIILATPAAYALSIAKIPRWRDSLFFFISTRMMPAVAIILPLYIIAKNVGVLDNVTMLALVYTVMNLPIAVWMIRSFLVEVPKEVLEAARIDGATFGVEIRRVILPMIAPGLAATALICFIFAWNEFFFAVSLTATQAATVPVFLVGFITSEGLFWARLSAASTMAALPVIIAGWVAQKWLVRGLSLGAVK
ncbi:carbohydrate ABC transporter membrane protein 2 (CUT1 family) [Prauserella shujinwangii]|uniref:Carbohydrate ABC transporter membrane protein 2 (CUT1 family) n=1 Tax=Prauserella shujinwangii TaxID=1453103 RepID=A0A2T0LL64_9PSEU|nr:carbohydrate ABC transporter permease [Prauserella shujinwangii]PRX43686.1 carbohydrate ABC transporter membrane protein 2 (CUT1 family) [Prauserella shujinwangii]